MLLTEPQRAAKLVPIGLPVALATVVVHFISAHPSEQSSRNCPDYEVFNSIFTGHLVIRVTHEFFQAPSTATVVHSLLGNWWSLEV